MPDERMMARHETRPGMQMKQKGKGKKSGMGLSERSSTQRPTEILKRRYAAGGISKEEFERRKNEIERWFCDIEFVHTCYSGERNEQKRNDQPP